MSTNPPPKFANSVPAVPQRIFDHLAALQSRRVAPGHNFNLYYRAWTPSTWEKAKTANKTPGPPEGLKQCLDFASVADLASAILYRQACAVQAAAKDHLFYVDAVSTSPFVTGLGAEHPNENGFAFLVPYGIPYLAGSGVKGVLRRAAQVLEVMEKLNAEDIDILFGKETENDENEALRGALIFHDLIPTPPPPGEQPATNDTCLTVEIMNAHHTGYLMPAQSDDKNATPHETENPNPIFFLAVPAGWRFQFLVTADPAKLSRKPLSRPWKDLLIECFRVAFDWLGFGAKTAVGYGALRRDASSGSSDAEPCSATFAQAPPTSAAAAWVKEFTGKMPTSILPDDRIFQRTLAEAWQKIEDADLRTQAREYIRQKWAESWYAPRKSRAKVRPLYGEDQ